MSNPLAPTPKKRAIEASPGSPPVPENAKTVLVSVVSNESHEDLILRFETRIPNGIFSVFATSEDGVLEPRLKKSDPRRKELEEYVRDLEKTILAGKSMDLSDSESEAEAAPGEDPELTKADRAIIFKRAVDRFTHWDPSARIDVFITYQESM